MLKIGFVRADADQKIGTEPKLNVCTSRFTNGKDFRLWYMAECNAHLNILTVFHSLSCSFLMTYLDISM